MKNLQYRNINLGVEPETDTSCEVSSSSDGEDESERKCDQALSRGDGGASAPSDSKSRRPTTNRRNFDPVVRDVIQNLVYAVVRHNVGCLTADRQRSNRKSSGATKNDKKNDPKACCQGNAKAAKSKKPSGAVPTRQSVADQRPSLFEKLDSFSSDVESGPGDGAHGFTPPRSSSRSPPVVTQPGVERLPALSRVCLEMYGNERLLEKDDDDAVFHGLVVGATKRDNADPAPDNNGPLVRPFQGAQAAKQAQDGFQGGFGLKKNGGVHTRSETDGVRERCQLDQFLNSEADVTSASLDDDPNEKRTSTSVTRNDCEETATSQSNNREVIGTKDYDVVTEKTFVDSLKSRQRLTSSLLQTNATSSTPMHNVPTERGNEPPKTDTKLEVTRPESEVGDLERSQVSDVVAMTTDGDVSVAASDVSMKDPVDDVSSIDVCPADDILPAVVSQADDVPVIESQQVCNTSCTSATEADVVSPVSVHQSIDVVAVDCDVADHVLATRHRRTENVPVTDVQQTDDVSATKALNNDDVSAMDSFPADDVSVTHAHQTEDTSAIDPQRSPLPGLKVNKESIGTAAVACNKQLLQDTAPKPVKGYAGVTAGAGDGSLVDHVFLPSPGPLVLEEDPEVDDVIHKLLCDVEIEQQVEFMRGCGMVPTSVVYFRAR